MFPPYWSLRAVDQILERVHELLRKCYHYDSDNPLHVAWDNEGNPCLPTSDEAQQWSLDGAIIEATTVLMPGGFRRCHGADEIRQFILAQTRLPDMLAGYRFRSSEESAHHEWLKHASHDEIVTAIIHAQRAARFYAWRYQGQMPTGQDWRS